MAAKKDTAKKGSTTKKATAPKTKKVEKTVSTIEATAETPILPEVENNVIETKENLEVVNGDPTVVAPVEEEKKEEKVVVEEPKKEVEPLTRAEKVKIINENNLAKKENVRKASGLNLIKNKITKYFGYTWNGQTVDD